MSLLDSIAQRLGYTKARQAQYPPHMLAMADAERFSVPDPSLYHNQAELYQRLSWVNSAVTIYAQFCASQTLSVKRLAGEDSEDVPNHEFELLLRRPNPLQSRFEFLEATYAFRRLCGNAYWWINAVGESITEIWIIPPSKIKPIPDGRQYLREYEYDPGDGRIISIPVEQIVHFKSFHPLSEFVGLSAIEPMATVAAGDLAQQRWNGNLFAKNNAKIPAALAFKDMINDPDWERLKDEVKANWGGTNRSGPLMLRGAGDGVNYLPMALSQKEMEFLASRQFTKEEIYGILAPGLSSILAVNATEANAKTGKATFIEFGVWPALCAVAEKITNDLMPKYGAEFVAEYDDIRVTDRVLEIQEQTEYARTHTIDEIRKKYYEDDPIGDERGELLPAQVTVKDGAPREPVQAEPEPVPEALQPFQNGQQPEQPGQEPPEQPAEQEQDNRKADLDRWRRKALKGLTKGSANVSFESDFIPSDLATAIRAKLADCKTPEDVRSAFLISHFGNNFKGEQMADQVKMMAELAREMKRANDLLEKEAA